MYHEATENPDCVQLLEFVGLMPDGARVDTEAGVIRGVKVIGLKSRNGRRYSAAALAKAVGMYEGIGVNVDHTKPGSGVRGLRDRIGRLANVTQTGDGGLRGDLHYLKSHPLAGLVVEAATRMPESMGLSHDAEGRTRVENGETVVEEITRVRSVDLVSDPATTKSLFEAMRPTDLPPERTTNDPPPSGRNANSGGVGSVQRKRLPSETKKAFEDAVMEIVDSGKSVKEMMDTLTKLLKAREEAIDSVSGLNLDKAGDARPVPAIEARRYTAHDGRAPANSGAELAARMRGCHTSQAKDTQTLAEAMQGKKPTRDMRAFVRALKHGIH
ncbi:MAG: hypothetical protein ACYC0Y_25585 [Pirellulales bacterium]